MGAKNEPLIAVSQQWYFHSGVLLVASLTHTDPSKALATPCLRSMDLNATFVPPDTLLFFLAQALRILTDFSAICRAKLLILLSGKGSMGRWICLAGFESLPPSHSFTGIGLSAQL